MEDVTTTTSGLSTDLVASSLSRYEGLIDIPLNERIIDALISLFNYFDIYAPKMTIVYNVVTFFRFFQLVGGAFMAANLNSFIGGTLTYKTMSIISILFHIIPLEYRRGRGQYVCYAVNGFLVLFAIYLIITALNYKKSSKVPTFSKYCLSIFMATFPFFLIPISVQYAGQLLSGLLTKDLVPTVANMTAIISSFIAVLLWLWIIIKAYAIALVFRQCSFQSIESTPQTKLLITTSVVTFASSLTTFLTSYPSAAMMILCIILYVYCTRTCFNCASFVKNRDRIMAFGGSIYGILLCAANLYTVFTDKAWTPIFFPIAAGVGVIVFISVYFYFKCRAQKELLILDELNDSQDIHIFKSIKKFKQILSTGFIHCHPVCVSFTNFKLAAAEWKDALDVWSLYAKFIAIYPEQSNQLAFIAQNVANIKTSDKILQSVILSSTNDIIKNRETKFTAQLKGKISRLAKHFNKAKGRLRNIWDLTLQGNIPEMNAAIKNALVSVNDCEIEMNHLLMEYHNNKYVMRQNVMFLGIIKGDPIESKIAADNLAKLQRGINVAEDTIHELGMLVFPTIPDICVDKDAIKITEVESNFNLDEYFLDESLDMDAIDTISRQIERHEIPSIRFIIWSTLIAFFFLFIVPLVSMLWVYYPYVDDYQIPVFFMNGIANTRSIISMLTGMISRYLLTMLDDPKNPGKKLQGSIKYMDSLSWKAFGGNSDPRDMIQYIAKNVGEVNAAMAPIRNYLTGNEYMEQVRDLIFTDMTPYYLYLNNTYYIQANSSISDISYMIATTVGKLCDLDEITAKKAAGSDSITARNNLQASLTNLNKSLNLMIQYLMSKNERYQTLFLVVILATIALNIICYPILLILQIKKLRRNRYEILSILTTLPKTVISGISSSFTNVKGESKNNSSSNDSETNRQEDSIIKLFASISDGSSKASIELVLAFCIFLLIVLGCLAYYFSMSCYIQSSNNVVFNCHHINYLLGSNAYLYSIMSSFYKVALARYHPIFEPTLVSEETELANIAKRIPTMVKYFQFIRLGGADIREIPFAEMGHYIEEATNDLTCNDVYEPPTILMDSTHCFSAVQQLYVATMLMKRYYGLMLQNPPIYPNAAGINLPQLWQIGPIELYLTFFYDAGESIVPIIVDNISASDAKQNIMSIAIILIAFFISMVIVFTALNESKFLKFCLKLFLRCPPSTIMNNQRIMDLLSGNYNYIDQDDQQDKFAKFSSDVINRLNDVIIVCQEETNKIILVNNSFEEMFEIKQNEIADSDIKEFFVESRFQCDDSLSKVFSQPLNMIFTKNSNEKVFFEFSSASFNGKKIFFGHDQTQNVMHEKLIADEKKKSDSMLASILPASLVSRVQAGEKNISFSV